jgi:hypothetical protein
MPENKSQGILPSGWTWERVQKEREKWGIALDMIPVATAPGCIAWGHVSFNPASR